MYPLHIADSKVNQKALRGILDPLLHTHGLAACEVTLRRERSGWVLRVTVENPESVEPGAGITLDACAEVSRDFSHALDGEDLIPFEYTLEVTSPGVERPLRTAAEFLRFCGKRAKIILSVPTPDGQTALSAEITSVDGENVTVTADKKAQTFRVADIDRAHLLFDLGQSPKGVPTRAPKEKAGKKSSGPSRNKSP